MSKVIPVLVASLVCDVAVADPSTGKKNLIGIFDKIIVDKFPALRPVHVYIKLTDAEGSYKIEVKYVQVSSGEILVGAEGPFEAKDRLASADLYLQFPPLPIPAPGRYEFQIWANSVYLGGTFVDALQHSNQN